MTELVPLGWPILYSVIYDGGGGGILSEHHLNVTQGSERLNNTNTETDYYVSLECKFHQHKHSIILLMQPHSIHTYKMLINNRYFDIIFVWPSED